MARYGPFGAPRAARPRSAPMVRLTRVMMQMSDFIRVSLISDLGEETGVICPIYAILAHLRPVHMQHLFAQELKQLRG